MGRTLFIRLWLLCAIVALSSWSRGEDDNMPMPPDYSDSMQWYISNRGSEADLFYIISTETSDYVRNGDTCHYADTYDRKLCRGMLKEMHAVDSMFSGNLNYYSPYYRQVTMQSWSNESLAIARLPIALDDVRRSWDYYIRYMNEGRPFIMAGFSQGAHAMLEIMKTMPDTVYQHMVAAYCVGYKVPQQMLDSFPYIRPAEGATDLGVTINFNSVREPEAAIPVVSGGNVVCINPVNWRTDTLTASFIYHSRRGDDTLTARMDPESRLVIVGNFKDVTVMPVIGRPGNYHHRELKLYYPYIRQNMADRVAAFLATRRRQD